MNWRETRIAVVGGTGALGGGLVRRMLANGLQVVVGSRDEDKAWELAETLRVENPAARVIGQANAEAAAHADVIVVAVPFASQAETLQAIQSVAQGKIVIDTSVCLQPPKVGTVQIPAAGSACMQAQSRLGPGVRVVAAFQNISAEHLQEPDYRDCDVLVCGDDELARNSVVELVGLLGLRGWSAGPLANSVAVEGLTSVLISLNRKYKISGGAGLRITGHD